MTGKGESMQPFNIYYINYDKAFEISMLIDNRLQETQSVTKGHDVSIHGEASADTQKLSSIPLLEKIIPKASMGLNAEGNKVKSVVDNFKMVSTKSIVLKTIYEKSIETRKLTDSKIGALVKIRNTSLRINNAADILATKGLLSGILNSVPVEGTTGVDFTQLGEVFLKDSAYIFTGAFGKEQIAFKIPMKLESEMESQYSISDLEIGPMTVIGIYRGQYDAGELDKKINRLRDLQNMSESQTNNSLIESDSDENSNSSSSSELKTHFIDVIAVIQELIIR
jgi:hypothetical protein